MRARDLINLLEGEPSKEDHFRERTNLHISLVKKFLGKILDLRDPRLNPAILLAEMSHDQSKFEAPEYEPYLYVNWTYYMKDQGREYNPPEDIKVQMDAATLHHVTHNPHHPEYWSPNPFINTKNRDEAPEEIVDASSMPLSYVASMVADWLAMSEEKGTCPYL